MSAIALPLEILEVTSTQSRARDECTVAPATLFADRAQAVHFWRVGFIGGAIDLKVSEATFAEDAVGRRGGWSGGSHGDDYRCG